MSALTCLLSARGMLVAGWSREGMAVDQAGHEVFATPRHHTAVAWSLVGALCCAEVDRLLDVELARRALRRVLREFDLPGWNRHPLRTQDEVLAAVDKAIVAEGGVPPLTRQFRRRVHRGGRFVSHGVLPRTAVQPRNPPSLTPEQRAEQLERQLDALREEYSERTWSWNLLLANERRHQDELLAELERLKRELPGRPPLNPKKHKEHHHG